MTLEIAQETHISSILELHSLYQVDSIKEEDKKDGFVTTAFTKEQFKEIIQKEQGLFIAIEDEVVVAYVICASWQYWVQWPMFEFMSKDLPNLKYIGQTLSMDNSYQYGPVCVHKDFRGSGLLEKIFNFALDSMGKRYDILVTFVNKINPRSYEAHKRKLGLEVINEFEFNNNFYYEFVYDTKQRVTINDKSN